MPLVSKRFPCDIVYPPRLTLRREGWRKAMGGAQVSRHLLLDRRIIERAQNVRLAVGKVEKDPHNPLFVEDRLWEVRFDNLYANVRYDERERLYRCWYNPFIVCAATTYTSAEQRKSTPYRPGPEREMGVCYATSKDGIAWEKPALGLIEFDGSRQNNLVLRDVHGVGVYHDPHDSAPARRYKAFMTGGAATSPDGLVWERFACTEIEAVGDTHNNAFFDERSRSYVGFTRNWDRGQRLVARAESQDFRTWTKAREVMRALPEEPHRQTYALIAFPYAGIYLGLAMVLDTTRDTVDAELAWSPDSLMWERLCPGSPVIPRGERGSYDWGCIYAAAYPVIGERDMLLYYGGSDDTHGSWRKACLARARMRPDGFAGMIPTSRAAVGEIVTKPVVCAGRNLWINADVPPGGSVRAGVIGADGLGTEDCNPTALEVPDACVTWRNGIDLANFVGERICLVFEIRAAELYSFGFSG